MLRVLLAVLLAIGVLLAIAEVALAAQRALQHWRRSNVAKRLSELRMTRSRQARRPDAAPHRVETGGR
jgi:hypothetical protein